MKQIILDTNFLLAAYQFKVDIISEIHRICNFPYRILVLERTLDELENISKTAKGKNREAIKWALAIIKKNQIKTLKTQKKESAQAHVDSLLLEKSREGLIIATQDKLLKKQLESQGGQFIILRQKKYALFINEKLP